MEELKYFYYRALVFAVNPKTFGGCISNLGPERRHASPGQGLAAEMWC
jgi:hypothetical protein